MTARCLEIAYAAGLQAGRKELTSEYAFLCPIHNDHDPSLLINDLKNCFFCGPCGMGGGPWKFAAFLTGSSPNDKRTIATWLQERGL